MVKKSNNVEMKGIFDELKEAAKEVPTTTAKTEEVVVKEDKKKNRSFMLSETTIKKLKELNFTLDKDLSSIVAESIDLFYKKNKEKIEETLK